MVTSEQDRICVGAIAGVRGLKGEVRIKSFTANPDDVAAYGPVSTEDGVTSYRIKVTAHAKGLVIARLDGIADRDAAEALKGYEDAVSYGKEAVDAVMKSNAIFVKGFQDINTALFGLAQTSMEDSVAATQKIFGCKTVADVIDAQSELAQANYAKALDDNRKISDLSVEVAEAASKPIAKQVNAAVEKFSKPIAA